MADPRNATTRKGIRPNVETFPIDGTSITFDATQPRGSAVVDRAVKISGQNQIGLVDTNERVLGKLLHVESDGMAAVQTGGYVDLPAGAAATVTPNTPIVGAQGASSAKGYIKTADAAQLAQVAASRGVITDSSTTTAVEVLLN